MTLSNRISPQKAKEIEGCNLVWQRRLAKTQYHADANDNLVETCRIRKATTHLVSPIEVEFNVACLTLTEVDPWNNSGNFILRKRQIQL